MRATYILSFTSIGDDQVYARSYKSRAELVKDLCKLLPHLPEDDTEILTLQISRRAIEKYKLDLSRTHTERIGRNATLTIVIE